MHHILHGLQVLALYGAGIAAAFLGEATAFAIFTTGAAILVFGTDGFRR